MITRDEAKRIQDQVQRNGHYPPSLSQIQRVVEAAVELHLFESDEE